MNNDAVASITEVRNAFQQWAGSFATTVSAGANTYADLLRGGITTAEGQLRAAQVYEEAFRSSASWATTFAEGARTAGNNGIAAIMATGGQSFS
jgi:hypothetical protein